MARAQLDELQGERINIKLLTDEEKATYRRAKSLAADRGLTIKNYTLLLYREDDKRVSDEREGKKKRS